MFCPENLDDSTRIHAGTAFVTMVALDKYGKPTRSSSDNLGQ